jgi:hypothetical protein
MMAGVNKHADMEDTESSPPRIAASLGIKWLLAYGDSNVII